MKCQVHCCLLRVQAERGSRERALVSERWIELSFAPCTANPDYGFLWWRNDHGRVFADAPATGRCARGNGGRHLLWIDPARELVIVSHWSDRVGELLRDVSLAVPEALDRFAIDEIRAA